MHEPDGAATVVFRELRGPRRRIRFTPVERASDDVVAKTLEEWSGCGWRVLEREYVTDLSLRALGPSARRDA